VSPGSFKSLSQAKSDEIDDFIQRLFLDECEGRMTDIADKATIELNKNKEFVPYKWSDVKTEQKDQPNAQHFFIQEINKVLFPDDIKSYKPLIDTKCGTNCNCAFKCL